MRVRGGNSVPGSGSGAPGLGPDGLYESFSGMFIWRRDGDTRNDCFHQRAGDSTIVRETLVVRPRDNQAEQYRRLNDAPIGYSVIQSPKLVNSWDPASFGFVFLIDKIKREVADDQFDSSVGEGWSITDRSRF